VRHADSPGARDQFAALLPIRGQILGPDHPDSMTTSKNFAYWAEQAAD
jgi:hypothetical protein